MSREGPAPGPGPVDVRAVQVRTVRVLTVSQMLGGLGTTIGIAVASVLAVRITGQEALGGFAQSVQVIGAAGASYFLARVMGERGRRPGLVLGYLLGAMGAGLCVVGGVLESFAILLLGALLVGANSATGYAARYAAADLATERNRGQALSTVLWATTIGAVLGPNLVDPAGRVAVSWGLPELTGPFLFSAMVTAGAALYLALALRPDPLLVARRLEGVTIAEVRSAEVRAAEVRAADEGTRSAEGGPSDATATQPGPTTGAEVRAGSSAAWRRALQVARARPGVGAGMIAQASAHWCTLFVSVVT